MDELAVASPHSVNGRACSASKGTLVVTIGGFLFIFHLCQASRRFSWFQNSQYRWIEYYEGGDKLGSTIGKTNVKQFLTF